MRKEASLRSTEQKNSEEKSSLKKTNYFIQFSTTVTGLAVAPGWYNLLNLIIVTFVFIRSRSSCLSDTFSRSIPLAWLLPHNTWWTTQYICDAVFL